MPSQPAKSSAGRPCSRQLARALAAAALFAAATAQAQTGAGAALPRWQVEASLSHDDNVSRGRRKDEILSDDVLGLRLSRDWDWNLATGSRLLLNAAAGGEGFSRNPRLSRAFVEVESAIDYRASGSFDEPTYSLFLRGTADQSRSTLRSANRWAAGARVAMALTDRINAVAALAYQDARARSAVFSGAHRAATLNLDYAASDNTVFYATLDARWGDATGGGRPSLENIDIAKVSVSDDAYPGAGREAYRFDARTIVTVLGGNRGIGSNMSIDLSWRRAQITPSASLPFVSDVPRSYLANQFVLSVSHRF